MTWFDIIKIMRRPAPVSREDIMDRNKRKTLGDYEFPETQKEWDSLENRITRSVWFKDNRLVDKYMKKMIETFKRKILRRPRDR
jgi:hypothetical protein